MELYNSMKIKLMASPNARETLQRYPIGKATNHRQSSNEYTMQQRKQRHANADKRDNVQGLNSCSDFMALEEDLSTNTDGLPMLLLFALSFHTIAAAPRQPRRCGVAIAGLRRP